MTDESCRQWRGQLSAWVLDQLGVGEAEELIDHLADCAPCQHELGELTQVAAALRMADPRRVGGRQQQPPATLGETIAARLAHERAVVRNRQRTRVAAAAVALVLAVVVATIVASPGDDDLIALDITEAAQGLGADMSVRDWGWGASLYITADGLQEGAVYRVWVEDHAGERQPAGSFLGVGGREISCQMAAATRLQDAATVVIDGPDGHPVLRGRVPAGRD